MENKTTLNELMAEPAAAVQLLQLALQELSESIKPDEFLRVNEKIIEVMDILRKAKYII